MERNVSNPQRRAWRDWVSAISAVLLFCCCQASAQVQTPGLTSLPSAEQVIQRNQDPFAGSLPQGKAMPEVIDLSVQNALDRGLKYNLGLYLSDRVTEQARAARLKALSELLPNINGAVTEEEQKINLKEFGLRTFPAFPPRWGRSDCLNSRLPGTWNRWTCISLAAALCRCRT